MTVTLHLPAVSQGSLFRGLSEAAARLRSGLAAALTAARRRRALDDVSALSDRELRDIGLARGELLYLKCASRRGPL